MERDDPLECPLCGAAVGGRPVPSQAMRAMERHLRDGCPGSVGRGKA